ncbi:MAG: 16S rRNA (cytosine(967)-C(5))-methyltransferase RsmB [Alkalicoccus sp.]|nr:MAG: 16S rRNA (cytosine(967)-C(5))-methyltransferase RsmB [Alkalicoccus sp.]
MSNSNVREASLDALLKIHKNQTYSNLLLNDVINQKKLSKVDVPLYTQIVYGTLQQQRYIDFILESFSRKALDKLESWVLVLLRLSIYQLKFLDRVPDHAVLNEAVTIAKRRGHRGISGMVNGILRSYLRNGDPELNQAGSPLVQLAVKTSHPDWMIERWVTQYGWETAEAAAEANNHPPGTSVRINPLRVSGEEAIAELLDEGLELEISPLLPDEALRINKGSAAAARAFQEGRITIQDESSMMAGKVLAPNSGDRILDACAAPGGKTTHLAELMQNTGEIISVDLHEHKIRLINQQAERLGLTNITACTGDARTLESETLGSFDKILVDAPCSGLGVIRRKPDMKWTKQQQDLERLVSIQKEILESVWKLLKPGGRLVYSTCTIDKYENELQVKRFMEDHNDAAADQNMSGRLPEKVREDMQDNFMLQLMPGKFGTDGFFMASLEKRSDQGE